MTDAERRLWQALRGRALDGARFRRQYPVGPYVVDFVNLDHHLIIEVDGGQHQDEAAHDATRTAFLERLGFRILRFWNNEVLGQTEAVLAVIGEALSPTPPPPPVGEESATP